MAVGREVLIHEQADPDYSVELHPSPSPTPRPVLGGLALGASGGLDGIFTPTPTRLPEYQTPNVPEAQVRVLPMPEGISAIVCAPGYAWDCGTALSIVRCESNYRPEAYNTSGASGLFQLMMPLHADLVGGDPFDPYLNTAAAYQLWLGKGWQPWAACL